MGWDVEIAAVRAPEKTPLEDFVPDVFDLTEQGIGWEEATSSVRDTDLCAGWLAGWGIVIDTRCRLSESASHLEEISAIGDVFVYRLAKVPVEVHHKDGKEVWRHTGLDAVLDALGLNKPKADEYIDGETIANDWFKRRLGLGFDDFSEAQYSIFALPL